MARHRFFIWQNCSLLSSHAGSLLEHIFYSALIFPGLRRTLLIGSSEILFDFGLCNSSLFFGDGLGRGIVDVEDFGS